MPKTKQMLNILSIYLLCRVPSSVVFGIDIHDNIVAYLVNMSLPSSVMITFGKILVHIIMSVFGAYFERAGARLI